jgi:hypothetical protein
MADDVKVKFGGDFSEIDKDAKSASNRIGTALGGWVDEYAKEVKHKLKDAFSLGNIAEKFYEGVKEYLQKFEDIDNMAKKLGVTRVELQQFGELGKETGVDMETMGQAIAFANRQLGGMKDNDKVRKLMLDLGFSTKEVTSANIKSLEILYKLADAYEKNKKQFGETTANNMLAKDSSDLFGRSAYNLNGIIKEGTSALKERIETMKLFSETEVKTAANANKMLKHGEETLKNDVYGGLVTLYAQLSANTDLGGFGGEGGLIGKALEESGMENLDEAMKSPESTKKFSENLSRQAKRKGYDTEMLIDMLTRRLDWGVLGTEEEANFYAQIQEQLRQMDKGATPQTVSAPKFNNQTVLSASSLQQIGGGDVSSVLAGSTTTNIETYTRITAENTTKLATEGTQPNTQTSVAK